MEKEYRWENMRIGQGHYYNNLYLCAKDAYEVSAKKWPNDVIRIEQFKPTRRILVEIIGGKEKIISEVGL